MQFFASRMADDARRNPAAVRERLRELQAFDGHLHQRPGEGLRRRRHRSGRARFDMQEDLKAFVRPMPEVPLKGKAKVPRVFEVVSAKAATGAR